MRTGAACDRANRGVEIGRGEIGHLRFRDVLELLARDLADLFGVRTARTRLDADRLLQQHARRRRLGDEGEAAIGIDRDDGRDRQARLELLRGGIERLAELHDVQTALTEGRAHGRRRIGLPRLDLQLDVAGYFLCHLVLLGVLASARRSAAAGLLRLRFEARECEIRDSENRRSALLTTPDPASPHSQLLTPSPPGRIPARPAWNVQKSAPPRAGGSFRS